MGKKTEKEKTVVIKNIVFTVIIIIFFVGIVLIFYNMLYEEKRNSIIQDGETSSKQTATQVNEYLSTSIDAIKLTAYTLDGMISEGRPNSDMLAYLVSQTDAIKNTVISNTTGMYGFINGEYLDGDGWVPDADYVPTERPWYVEAVANGGKITTIQPYLDAQTGQIIMTLAKTLSDGKSVIAFDVGLDRIQYITENSVIDSAGGMEFIIDGTGFVIAHSSKGEVGKNYGKEPDTLGAVIYRDLISTDSDSWEIDLKGSHYIVYTTKIQNDWQCISVLETTNVFSSLAVIASLMLAAVIVIVFITCVIMLSSSRRQLIAENLNSQLSSTADIYISMNEIDLLTDTFKVVRISNPEIAEIIGNERNNCRRKIKEVMEKASDISSRDVILDFVDLGKLDHRLSERNTITCEFLGRAKQWRRARFIVSERTPGGRVARVMYLVEDIDTEKRDRDMTLEAVRLMTEQISSVANIYFSMHDIDLPNDTFTEIKTRVQKVSDLVDGSIEHAQATMNAVMDQMAHESSRAAIHEFIDLSTLNERLKNTNTVTEEFLSYKNIWSRARFIVSKRLPDGKIDHVLWLVEGIDAERRKREKLAETAEALNYRIISIANIYMTAHELDITNDTFTVIKSMRSVVNGMVGEDGSNAQEKILKVMTNVTDESCVADVRRFVELSTLGQRLRRKDTISIEYMNKDKLWRRGRFVVSRRDDKGKLTHVMWLIEDIDSERRERNKLIDMSMRAIASSEAKTSFLSNITRDIRSPLKSMLGVNEMIIRESNEINIVDYAENVDTTGRLLLGLVNDILDFSKIESGKMKIEPKNYDITFMINDLFNMIHMWANEKGITLACDISRDLPKMFYGDERNIKQVIMNLLTNAVKYTEKGSVILMIRYDDIPDEPESIMLNVSVKDTGIGMSWEDAQRIVYGPLSDNDSDTKGLGMRITRKLLEMMGSKLEVESVLSLGSKFSFSLKQKVIDREPLGEYRDKLIASVGKREKHRLVFRAPEASLLVVDDVQMNLTVISKILKQITKNVDTAQSGNEAVAFAERRKYDLIFLDQMMPGKNGVETLKEIRTSGGSMNKDTPVICLTADVITGAREQYISSGFDDYITKPIDPAVLEKVLYEHLSRDKKVDADDVN